MGIAVARCLQAANEALVAGIADEAEISLTPPGAACRKHTNKADCYIWVVSSFFGPGTMCVFHFNVGEIYDEGVCTGKEELWWCEAFENDRIHTLSDEEEDVLEEVYQWLVEEGHFDGEDK